MRTKLVLLLAAFCLPLGLRAAGPELISGYTYGVNSPSNLVTYVNLNSHVKDATIAPGAITNRTAGVFNTNFWLLAASNNTLYRVQATNLIPAGFVGITELSTDVAGLGLGGGGGAALSNKTDNAFLQITNDVLTISLTAFTNLISAVSSNIASYFINNYTATNPAAQCQVNFLGSSGAIKGSSINVSNVNRTSEGDYTVAWTNALANTNYLVLLGSYKTAAQDESWVFVTSKTTTNLTLKVTDESPNDHDLHEIYLQIP